MPIAAAGSYEYTPSKLTAKLTSSVAAAAEVVAQVVSMTLSGSERDIEEQAYIGLDAKRQMIKGKGAETLELTLKAVSPDFEALCKQSWDNPGVTLTLAVISKGINFRGTEADNSTRTQTFIGVVTKRLEVAEYVAGEPTEFQMTIALNAEPTTATVSP
jgi:hypothetical protein